MTLPAGWPGSVAFSRDLLTSSLKNAGLVPSARCAIPCRSDASFGTLQVVGFFSTLRSELHGVRRSTWGGALELVGGPTMTELERRLQFVDPRHL